MGAAPTAKRPRANTPTPNDTECYECLPARVRARTRAGVGLLPLPSTVPRSSLQPLRSLLRRLRRCTPRRRHMTAPLAVRRQCSTRQTGPAVATIAVPADRYDAPCCPCGGRWQRGGPISRERLLTALASRRQDTPHSSSRSGGCLNWRRRARDDGDRAPPTRRTQRPTSGSRRAKLTPKCR